MPLGDRKLEMHELGRPAPDEPRVLHGRRVCVVLDDVRSRHNVGSIFRTCDAFGVERLLLCGMTPVPPHREIEKTALGATATVPWEQRQDGITAVEELKREGYFVLAIEQTEQALALGEVSIADDAPLALVFGNELHGVSNAVIAACHHAVVVPQVGSKHSLNVSVCAGVVIWTLVAVERKGASRV